jgi:hypothetical protein
MATLIQMNAFKATQSANFVASIALPSRYVG